MSLSWLRQFSSDEESEGSDSSSFLPPSKLANREGIGVEEAGRRGKRTTPPSRPTAPPPSQKLLLQHQQNRKRASALELRLKKRVGENTDYDSFSILLDVCKYFFRRERIIKFANKFYKWIRFNSLSTLSFFFIRFLIFELCLFQIKLERSKLLAVSFYCLQSCSYKKTTNVIA